MSNSIQVKVIDGDKRKTGFISAGPGRFFSPFGALKAVSEFVWKLKDAVPGSEYRVVKVGTNRYNIISLGR